MGDESSPIVRLSTRDVAPADRLSYASWILGSALAPAAVSAETPSQYALDVTALELPSIAIVAQSGSPQRSIRARSEIRRTSQRYFFLALVLSGSWQVAHVTRTRLGPGEQIDEGLRKTGARPIRKLIAGKTPEAPVRICAIAEPNFGRT